MFSEEVEIVVVNEEYVDKDGDSPGDGGDGEEVDGDLGNKVAFQSFLNYFSIPAPAYQPIGNDRAVSETDD